jgi:hypothetical protein
VISLSHVHIDSKYLNLRKRHRLAIRGSICLIILLLPLSHSLNSLQLIGLVTALLWFVIGVETWGNALHCHVWIGDKKRREYVCKYNTRCVQGEEQVPEDAEETSSEEGDIIFGV